MKTLSIDIETFSSINLAKAGVNRYVESPDFEILLFGYSLDGSPVQVLDLACGEKLSGDMIDALTDESVTKWAFNANFERVCLIKCVEAPDLQTILELRYLCFNTWEEISVSLHLDIRWVHRLHNKALNEVDAIRRAKP